VVIAEVILEEEPIGLDINMSTIVQTEKEAGKPENNRTRNGYGVKSVQ
jgi:hypothetical protein